MGVLGGYDGVPLGIVYRRQGSKKTKMMGLSDGRKSFKIGLAVLIQYRRVTDTRPPSQPRCRSKDRAYVYVARVKMKNFPNLRML